MTDKDSREDLIAEAVTTLRSCVHGLMHIPSEHLELFPYIPEIEELADRLAALSQPDAEKAVAYIKHRTETARSEYDNIEILRDIPPGAFLYPLPFNLGSKATRKRLASLWGFVRPEDALSQPGEVTGEMFDAAYAAYDSTSPHSASLRAALTAALGAQTRGEGVEVSYDPVPTNPEFAAFLHSYRANNEGAEPVVDCCDGFADPFVEAMWRGWYANALARSKAASPDQQKGDA